MTIEEQIEPILRLYGQIKIFALNRQKGIRFSFWNESKQEVFSKIEQVPIAKIKRTSEKEGEDIYFMPVFETTSGVIFLDDVPAQEFDTLPVGSLVVETSPKRYQVHVPLEKPMPLEQADQIQKMLVSFIGADPGSKDLRHFRRLPGFPNKKYPEQPLVTLKGTVGKNTWKNLILALQENQKLLQEEQQKRLQGIEAKNPEKVVDLRHSVEYAKQIWTERLQRAGGDESRADISFAMHLLRNGYTDEQVKYILFEVSEDLKNRKAGHVDDYLTRTIEKAKQYLLTR